MPRWQSWKELLDVHSHTSKGPALISRKNSPIWSEAGAQFEYVSSSAEIHQIRPRVERYEAPSVPRHLARKLSKFYLGVLSTSTIQTLSTIEST